MHDLSKEDQSVHLFREAKYCQPSTAEFTLTPVISTSTQSEEEESEARFQSELICSVQFSHRLTGWGAQNTQ